MAEKSGDLKFPRPSNTALLRPKEFELQKSRWQGDTDTSGTDQSNLTGHGCMTAN